MKFWGFLAIKSINSNIYLGVDLKTLIKHSTIVFCFALLSYVCKAQIGSAPCQKAKEIIGALNNNHIQPPALNEAWGESVFNEFMYLLDPGKYFFTSEDLAKLSSYKANLTDLQNSNCSLVYKTHGLFKEKLTEASLLIERHLKSSPDYSKSGFIEWGSKRTSPFAGTQADLELKWKASLKLKILFWMRRNSAEDLSKLTPQQFNKLEALGRVAIKLKEQGRIARQLNPTEGFEEAIEILFLKAVARSFDPHTEYFTISQNEDFNSSLSSEGLSFGVELDEDNFGQIKISGLVPGGPAWLSNELNQGDILVGLKWPGMEPTDIIQYDLEELERELDSSNKTEVALTVKKANNQIKTIWLTKEKVQLDQNLIKSFLLNGEKTIGYIYLPGFYLEFEDQSNKGCTDDIARELVKLKKEKIDGLILDLRFNGGGSLKEALALSGIFIDAGPLALIKETGQPIVTLKDLNRGTIYEGPLLIMINGLSASASELVTAVLQDLNRAIVVGGPTYGKATGQVVIPIGKNSVGLTGYLKVTNDKIYRVSGKSLQRKGVVPDIELPDVFNSFIEREKDFNNSLIADSVIKKVYYTPLASLPIPELRTNSEKRRLLSSEFSKMEQAEIIISRSIPLDLKGFDQSNNLLDSLFKNMDQPSEERRVYKVQLNQLDNPLLLIDNHERGVREEILDEIKACPYIEEAYKIILDYISLLKSKQK